MSLIQSTFCNNCYNWGREHLTSHFTIKCLYAPTCFEPATCFVCSYVITGHALHGVYQNERRYMHTDCHVNLRNQYGDDSLNVQRLVEKHFYANNYRPPY